jgi:hypothetical protein
VTKANMDMRSSVSVVTRLQAGSSPGGARYIPFFEMSRLASKPTELHVQWIPRFFPRGVKWSGRDANHSFRL